MSQFQLFDSVKLVEPIALEAGQTAPMGTMGAVVEVFNQGEAFLVELFGNWVTCDEQGGFVAASQDEPNAFMETIGVETVHPHQIELVASARETMGVRHSLRALADELSDELVAEVLDFAEFLKQKQERRLPIEG